MVAGERKTMTISLSLLKVTTSFSLFFLLSLYFFHRVVAMIFFLSNYVEKMIGYHRTKMLNSQSAVLFHSLSEQCIAIVYVSQRLLVRRIINSIIAENSLVY